MTSDSPREVERYQFKSLSMLGAMYDARDEEFTKASGLWFVLASDYDHLQAEVAALKELLRKYGKHMISCDVVMLPGVDQCTCGYDAALARGGV